MMACGKTPGEQAIAQVLGFHLHRVGEMDGNIGAHGVVVHVLGQESAFQGFIMEAVAHSDDLGAEHPEGVWVQFSIPVGHGAQHRQALHRAVVEDFDQIGGGVREAQIGFVQDQRAAKFMQDMEDRRYGGRARREEALVCERAQRQQPARLARAVFAGQPEIRHFDEGVIYPREQNVVGGNVFENGREAYVAVDEGFQVREQRGLGPRFLQC